MRRQLKLQGQLTGPYLKRDNDETSDKASRSLKQQTECSDSEHWERQQEGENYPWTKAVSATLSQSVTQRSGMWERPEGPEGPSSEQLRSCSIAKLRAKAREHKAEIHSTVNMSGGDTQSQTEEADAMHNDWSFSFFLFVQIIRTKKTADTHYAAVTYLFLTFWDEEFKDLPIINRIFHVI